MTHPWGGKERPATEKRDGETRLVSPRLGVPRSFMPLEPAAPCELLLCADLFAPFPLTPRRHGYDYNSHFADGKTET